MRAKGDLTIRRLRPSDGEQMAALLTEAFAEEFEGGGTEAAAVNRLVRAAGWAQQPGIRHALTLVGARFVYFVATYRGRLIGSTAVGGARLPVISSVAVLPRYRGLGVAKALMDRAQAYVWEHGHDRVVLDVLAHNTAAVELYRALGYHEYHRYRSYTLALPGPPSATVPAGYWLEPLSPKRAASFGSVERAAMPSGYFEVAPTLRDHFLLSAAMQWTERFAGGSRSYRRVLVHDGRTAGFLAASATAGQAEGRIEYPLVLPDASVALPGALIDAVNFLAGQKRRGVRLDLSEQRPEQHAAAESLNFHHRWTFLQLVRWRDAATSATAAQERPLRLPAGVRPPAASE